MTRPFGKIPVLIATFFLFLLVLGICPFLGPTPVSFSSVFHPSLADSGSQDAKIFFEVRLPRNFLAALAGAVMACAGVVFQAVLRNPLACPFTLGVAGGSSFGAVLAILLGLSVSAGGVSFLTLGSFFGALLSLLLVFSLAAFLRSFSAPTLLLAGIAINYFFSALVLFAYYTADFTQSYSMMHWMMGSLDVIEMSSVKNLFWLVLAGVTLLWALSRDLNLLSAGEELAKVKGVATKWVIGVSVLSASLLTSAVVALTGPIAFVGLIVPHIYRLWIGNDHRYLLPCSVLGGASFLMVCDTAARSLFGPTELPVGVLTALLGVPALLWLLFRGRTYRQN
jgi:iron complex transport system permease protein